MAGTFKILNISREDWLKGFLVHTVKPLYSYYSLLPPTTLYLINYLRIIENFLGARLWDIGQEVSKEQSVKILLSSGGLGKVFLKG